MHKREPQVSWSLDVTFENRCGVLLLTDPLAGAVFMLAHLVN